MRTYVQKTDESVMESELTMHFLPERGVYWHYTYIIESTGLKRVNTKELLKLSEMSRHFMIFAVEWCVKTFFNLLIWSFRLLINFYFYPVQISRIAIC